MSMMMSRIRISNIIIVRAPSTQDFQQKFPGVLLMLLLFKETIKAPKKDVHDDVPDPDQQHNNSPRSQHPRFPTEISRCSLDASPVQGDYQGPEEGCP